MFLYRSKFCFWIDTETGSNPIRVSESTLKALRPAQQLMTNIYLALVFVLEVIETIATFSLATRLKVSQEVIIGSITSSHLLNGDELLILDEEDTVTVAETEDLV